MGLLKNLTVLDLGANQLFRPISREIGNLSIVKNINLLSNGSTGMLYHELGHLKSLQELPLDRNKLLGTVPGAATADYKPNMHGMYATDGNATGLCHLSQLQVAELSYNFFGGNILKCLPHLPSASFQGNCLEGRGLKQHSDAQCGSSISAKSHSNSNANATHIKKSTSSLITTYYKSSIIIPWKKSGSDKERLAVYTDSELLKDIQRFNRQDLEVACNIIGSSSDSMIYKGTTKGGSEIAVISFCVKEEQWTGYHELYFQRKVADLARLNHENAAKLLGYCRETPPFTRMLVFEYACNGTLYEHLHCIARGLRYLHTELHPPFTSAVYLTEDFSPELVDFESWNTIIARSEKNSSAIDSNGAICVLPHSIEAHHLDIRGNVYAFGVLLLEIVSGRPPFFKDTGSLVDWAREYLEVPEVMPYTVEKQLKHSEYEDLKAVCEAARLCLNPDPVKRPWTCYVLCTLLESWIDLFMSAELRSSSLTWGLWAELALLTCYSSN
uniref:Protein kinase domain-containing protein n=1 Tax=Chenopodium quinoa TaxID=63459 RepID=A0A803LQN2_CHEQI